MTSHQRLPSSDLVKEPHAVSLKVLRLSRPSLVAQLPLPPPTPANAPPAHPSSAPIIPASLAYAPSASSSSAATESFAATNPTPFLLSPILQLPPSFGSAYVGETFSCTLCANHEALDPPPPPTSDYAAAAPALEPPPPPPPAPSSSPSSSSAQPRKRRTIRDVRIDAEMKTPLSSGASTKLVLRPPLPFDNNIDNNDNSNNDHAGVDLDPGQTLQRIIDFDLKEEGNHVLGVTVSYYEATETSGRTRSFRKLYQFVCKPSLIVRTKAGLLGGVAASQQQQQQQTPPPPEDKEDSGSGDGGVEGNKEAAIITKERRRWVLEAQLENCGEDTMELERVQLMLEDGLAYRDCNWEASGSPRPVLHPQEVEQVCFVVEEKEGETAKEEEEDGRIVFGVLGVGWRGEMGSKGFLATGKLGARV